MVVIAIVSNLLTLLCYHVIDLFSREMSSRCERLIPVKVRNGKVQDFFPVALKTKKPR